MEKRRGQKELKQEKRSRRKEERAKKEGENGERGVVRTSNGKCLASLLL